MRVPQLNRALVLEAVERTPDGAGGFTDEWRVLGSLWTQILPGRGRVARDGLASISRIAVRVVVRASPVGAATRPAAGQRFRDADRVYVINAVTEHDPQGRYLTCFADEEIAI